MASSTVRVLGMKAMGPVRLAGLRKAISSSLLKNKWYVSGDKNALTMSLRPRDEPIVPHLPSQLPFRRLASHMTVTRRGVIVLVNCDLEACLEPLALARSHAGDIEVDAAVVPPVFGDGDGLQQGPLRKLVARLGLGAAGRPPLAPLPVSAMPFEGPAAARAEVGLRRVSDYLTVKVRRSLDGWCALEDGTLAIKRLDLDSVRVIAGAMERSIELQVQEGAADRLHAEAAWLNERVRVRSPATRAAPCPAVSAGGRDARARASRQGTSWARAGRRSGRAAALRRRRDARRLEHPRSAPFAPPPQPPLNVFRCRVRRRIAWRVSVGSSCTGSWQEIP